MASTNEKILVPIGFTNQSILALQQAVIVAKRTNSDLVLLSGVEMPSVLQMLFSDYDEKQIEFKDKVRDNLNELVDQYCADVNVAECIVAVGKIYEKITETAEMIDASLIIMGTDGTPKEIKKKFIGSNANNVVRSATCPVITLKGKEIKNQCDLIALPLDLNKETREKVTHAIKFARLFHSSIRVFSVSFDNNDDTVKNKLKRNLKLSKDYKVTRDINKTIINAKPPIFWKDKEVVKNQIMKWTPNQIIKLLTEVNDIEYEIKKNNSISLKIISNFILDKAF